VRFLAVLELVKRGEADVAQAGAFGQIDVSWLGEKGPGNASETDEYDGTWVEEDPEEIVLDAEIRLDERAEEPAPGNLDE
jgi:chromatin segregation and condensation protein Rec8/ScpA/Scc1 (kleisin family)